MFSFFVLYTFTDIPAHCRYSDVLFCKFLYVFLCFCSLHLCTTYSKVLSATFLQIGLTTFCHPYFCAMSLCPVYFSFYPVYISFYLLYFRKCSCVCVLDTSGNILGSANTIFTCILVLYTSGDIPMFCHIFKILYFCAVYLLLLVLTCFFSSIIFAGICSFVLHISANIFTGVHVSFPCILLQIFVCVCSDHFNRYLYFSLVYFCKYVDIFCTVLFWRYSGVFVLTGSVVFFSISLLVVMCFSSCIIVLVYVFLFFRHCGDSILKISFHTLLFSTYLFTNLSVCFFLHFCQTFLSVFLVFMKHLNYNLCFLLLNINCFLSYKFPENLFKSGFSFTSFITKA